MADRISNLEDEHVSALDRAAFERLWSDVAPGVLAMATRWTGDREEAEDVTIEVCLRLWRQFHIFQGRDSRSIRHWACRIAHQVALDQLRRSLRHRNPIWKSEASTSSESDFRSASLPSLAQRIIGLLAQVPEGRTTTQVAALVDAEIDVAAAVLARLVGAGQATVEGNRFQLLGNPTREWPSDLIDTISGEGIFGSPLQSYSGSIDRIEEGTAFLTLQDSDERVIDAEYPSEQLQTLGLSQGDRFLCELIRTPLGVELRFEPVSLRELTDEEQVVLAEKWNAVSDAF